MIPLLKSRARATELKTVADDKTKLKKRKRIDLDSIACTRYLKIIMLNRTAEPIARAEASCLQGRRHNCGPACLGSGRSVNAWEEH